MPDELDGFRSDAGVVTDDKLKKSFLNSAVGIGSTGKEEKEEKARESEQMVGRLKSKRDDSYLAEGREWDVIWEQLASHRQRPGSWRCQPGSFPPWHCPGIV